MTNESDIPDWADPDLCRSLARILRAGESETVEFKRDYPKQARELAKEMAALAPGGGLILIGVTDGGELTGLGTCASPEDRDALVRRVEGLLSGTITPPLKPRTMFGVFEGRTCLAIKIPQHDQPIFYSGNIPYIRNQRESRPARPEEVIDRIRAWLGIREAAQPVSDEGQVLAGLNAKLLEIAVQIDLLKEPRRFMNPWLENFGNRCEWWAGELRESARELVTSDPVLAESVRTVARRCEEISIAWASLRFSEDDVHDLERRVQEIKSETLDGMALSAGAVATLKEHLADAANSLEDVIEKAEIRDGMKLPDTVDAASRIGVEAYRVSQYPIQFMDETKLQELRARLREVAMVDTITQYWDGGVSEQKIIDTIRSGYEALRAV